MCVYIYIYIKVESDLLRTKYHCLTTTGLLTLVTPNGSTLTSPGLYNTYKTLALSIDLTQSAIYKNHFYVQNKSLQFQIPFHIQCTNYHNTVL